MFGDVCTQLMCALVPVWSPTGSLFVFLEIESRLRLPRPGSFVPSPQVADDVTSFSNVVVSLCSLSLLSVSLCPLAREANFPSLLARFSLDFREGLLEGGIV